jgi:hypothetical protein
VFDQTVTVSGNGLYASPSFTPAQTGTYWWIASHSGDTSNNQAATNCGDESVTITPSGHLYWTDFTSVGMVNEANLDGGNPLAIVAGQSSPSGVAVRSSILYWADSGSGTIVEAGLDGGNPRTIVFNQSGAFSWQSAGSEQRTGPSAWPEIRAGHSACTRAAR